MKKYLITGISGFVAFHFLEYINSIQSEKIEVLGISSKISPDGLNHIFQNLEIHYLALNLLDYRALEIATVSFSPTHIIHFVSL